LDNLCPLKEEANTENMPERRKKLYSSFVRLEEPENLGAKKEEKWSKTRERMFWKRKADENACSTSTTPAGQRLACQILNPLVSTRNLN
jgi:hypothetical protein